MNIQEAMKWVALRYEDVAAYLELLPCLIEVHYGRVSWVKSPRGFRLFIEEKPYEETTFPTRVDCLRYLDGLKKEANRRQLEIISTVKQAMESCE